MIKLKAKAKINLFLHVNGRLVDDYHSLDSLVVFAEDIYDEIEIVSANRNYTSIVGGEFASLLQGQKNNLINQSLNLFTKNQFYHCKLIKNIPISSGLGGGSSDAATVARFLDKNITNSELMKIGADLPICYHGRACYFSSKGEVIKPLGSIPLFYLLLVNPNKPLFTKDVFLYNKNVVPFIESKPTYFSGIENLIDFLLTVDNVLTTAAKELMWEIGSIIDALALQDGCKIARMSGSGPTCFGFFKSENQVLNALKEIKRFFPNYWVRYTQIGA